MKKDFSKLRQRFKKHIEHAAQRVQAFSSKLWWHFKKHIKHATQRVRVLSSKLWQFFREHFDITLFIFVSLLATLALLAGFVIFRNGTAIPLQQLLGLKSEKYDVLKFIGYCVAGVVSIWLAWAANKRANAMDATAKNTEAGQRQERLKNAIEHLGHKRDSVRMGGAYELFHLAKDTGYLRQTVMDILCAHIRQTTTGQTTRGNAYQAEHKTKPSEEIQSLLTLLFREKHDVFEGCSINLQSSYLNGANLTKAKLYGAVLDKAQLQGADLMTTQLQGADLNKAQLQGADLTHAQLQGSSLRYARMQRADLRSVQLRGAILWAARMQGASLRAAQLQGANFEQAQLQGASLWAAQLQGANFEHAQLQKATLAHARMQGADLMNAQLQGANLFKARLQGANLKKAQLQGVSSHDAYPLPPAKFERKIKNQIGKDSDLTGIIFAGGLREKDLEVLCEGLSDYQAKVLRKKLTPHIGQPASHELPKNSGAKTGTYTQKEAKRWIAEYNRAMRKASRADDTADAASAPDSDKDKED